MINNESGEDYLEAILRLSAVKDDVHSVEVARELGVSKPAVTKAMRLLTQKGYVSVVDNHIHLTDSGKKYLIPAVREFVTEIDINHGIMKIKPIEGLFGDQEEV